MTFAGWEHHQTAEHRGSILWPEDCPQTKWPHSRQVLFLSWAVHAHRCAGKGKENKKRKKLHNQSISQSGVTELLLIRQGEEAFLGCLNRIKECWDLLFSPCDQTLLRDINVWAEKHPREILILSLSHFKGFNKKNDQYLHNHLINFIKTLFGNKLVPRKVKVARKFIMYLFFFF